MEDSGWSGTAKTFVYISLISLVLWGGFCLLIAATANSIGITLSSLGISQGNTNLLMLASYCFAVLLVASIMLERDENRDSQQRKRVENEEREKYEAKERRLLAMLETERSGLRSEIAQEKWQLAKKKRKIKKKVQDILQSAEASKREVLRVADIRQKEARWYAQSMKRALTERAAGFRSLHESVSELDTFLDNGLEDYLKSKKRPAVSAANAVREQTRLRRKAEVEAKTARSVIEYYERMFPELVEIRQNELENAEQSSTVDTTYTEQERQDPATDFVAKEEYLKLNPAERNQLALDRYWKRQHSSGQIGKMYERYVGYLYESKGYEVRYYGIDKGLDDLGRDLLCIKGREAVVVQCKNWSKYKTVRENRIFQHFGTVFEYKQRHPDMEVTAAFYTTTAISSAAKEFAKTLGMYIFDNHKFDKGYPCIKCNIGRDGLKIYHLPFDQQYDKVSIEPNKGEFFAKTIKEAEDAGFRRAYRWRGNKS